MKREIRFRAWTKGRMIEIKDNHSMQDLVEKDDWKVMQYTGLKDMFGKEIYEGDIVCLDWKEEARGAIVYGAGFWKIKWNEEGKSMNRRVFILTGLKVEDTAPFEYSNSQLEIIGDVFRNPELLKEQR